jgi:phosphomannomutase
VPRGPKEIVLSRIPCFKAYDVRGKVPDELNEDIARKTALAYAARLKPKKVVVGHDVRDSSPALTAALTDGFLAAGVDVIDIGLCGTEMIYFGAFHLEREGVDGGIMVTASHNPKGYNGLKLVTQGARPISGDTGLREIEAMVAEGPTEPTGARGTRTERDLMPAFVEHLLGWVDKASLKPLTLVCNAGNGGAGLVIDALEPHLPFTFIKVHHDPDSDFPHGIPNPLLEENRAPTAAAVKAHGADLGIAWDGDYDRCFFFDEQGAFLEGYYVVGLFAAEMLRREEGAAIIHDPRLVWNTQQLVDEGGGRAVMSKTGHAFIKERMRSENAIYGGEMSAHHYFRDFAYCDSGMIPWLLMAQLLSAGDHKASELFAERASAFPVSGEINRRLDDPQRAIAAVRARYEPVASAVDETDGLSLDFGDWRLNLRMSNTEPILRLNVEARGDAALMATRRDEVLSLIESA